MTDHKDAARARGKALREQRAARARQIRRRVISGAVALFVAAWLMITIVLVSGHDPALARKTSTTSSVSTVASTPSTTTTTSSSGSTGASSSSSTGSGSRSGAGIGSSSGSSSNGSGVSSVTTSQS